MKKEEYEMTLSLADLRHLVSEIEFEIKEYSGNTSDDFVVLYDSTVYQMMQVLNMVIGMIEGADNTKTVQEMRDEK